MTLANRKDRILGVAERLFRHYGPQKTTMADIAREAEIGVGTVYLDFPSKEAILDELSRRRGMTVARMMASAADGSLPGTRAAERLRRMLEARVAALFILAGEGAHACDLVHCHSSQPASFDEEARRLVREEIATGIRLGEFACEVEPTVRAIEVAFAALSPPHLFRFDRRDATDLAERLAQLIVSGVRGEIARSQTERSQSQNERSQSVRSQSQSSQSQSSQNERSQNEQVAARHRRSRRA